MKRKQNPNQGTSTGRHWFHAEKSLNDYWIIKKNP